MRVGLVRLDAPPGALEAGCEPLLDADERSRLGRLRHPLRRREFVVARALVRTMLSRYGPVAPGAWRFGAGPHGRPEVVGPVEAPPLRFNVSHTRSVVGCAVARGSDVGLDLEDVRKRRRVMALAARHFAPAEVTGLRALEGAARTERFFDVWTLKESYVKARGLGLRVPLHRFAFAFGAGGTIAVTFDPTLGDDAAGWHFALRTTAPEHRVAVAVRRAGDAPLRLTLDDVVPGA